MVSGRCLVVTQLKTEKILVLLGQNRSENEPKAIFGPKNDQKQKFGLRRGFFGPNQKVQKTKYVFTRPIHPPEVVSNQNFEIGTLSPPSKWGREKKGKKKAKNAIFFQDVSRFF